MKILQRISAQCGAKLAIILFIAGVSYLVSVGSVQAVTAPSAIATSTLATTSILVTWTDNSTDETDFYVGRSTDGTTYNATTTVHLVEAGTTTGATSTSITGLAANTRYWFRVAAAANGAATTTYSTIGSGTYTLTTAPTAPTVGTPTISTLPITVADNSATDYAVRVVSTTWTGYLQPTGVLGASAYWFTYAQAGNGSATTTSGLVANTSYTVGVTGRNGDTLQTATTTATAKYTYANTPSAVSATPGTANVSVGWGGDATNYYVEYIEASAYNSAWTTAVSYNFTSGLGCGSNTFRVKGRNGDLVDTAWAGTVSATLPCTGDGGASVPPSTFVVTPTVPVVPATPVVPVIPVVPPAEQPVVPAAPSVEAPAATPSVEVQSGAIFSNPESKVVVSNVPAVSFQPGAKLQFTYEYQNDTAKKVTVKIVRQLVNSVGKVVKTTTVSKTLKADAVLVANVNEPMAKTLAPGGYTVKVKVLDNKNKVLDENSFGITVEKLKKKTFIMGEVASMSSDLAFDEASLAKVKSNVAIPVTLKLKYSYTNTTSQKQTVRMVREVLDASGAVKSVNSGKWVMAPGEKYVHPLNQPVASNLSTGEYTLRLRALDWKTKEVLAENSLNFIVELK